jgi:hypothetical protein
MKDICEPMYQLIGGLLAFFSSSPPSPGLLAGAVFALLTFIWVVVAKPRGRTHALRDDRP